jgi:hypothetical protein
MTEQTNPGSSRTRLTTGSNGAEPVEGGAQNAAGGAQNAAGGAQNAAGVKDPRQAAWAQPIDHIKVRDVPDGATNLNVDGRQPASPLQGFGQMWQKTFRVRLSGVDLTPAQVMEIWMSNFQKFQPPENQFYPTLVGIKPGEVLLIQAKVPPLPGMPPFLPVATGVMVLYADDTTVTVMTPEGHPEAGWNTFSVSEEDGAVVAQCQSLCRPSDPIYELFNRYLGASSQQDKIWTHVLESLAEHFNVSGQVTMSKVLVDPKVQWKQARNIWHNAAMRTVVYVLASPLRWIRGAGNRKQTS